MRRLWWTFLRFFFRQLYNELACTYDLVAWVVSLGQWRAWGRTAIPHLPGKRVLELGHGPGHLLVAMAERGLTPVGLDLSPHMGRLAQRRLRRAQSSIPLVRAQTQDLPFSAGCFDSAVATFPTEFILNLATLREVARVLRRPEPAACTEPCRSACTEPCRSACTEPCRSKGPSGGRLVVVAWARLSERDPLSRFIGYLYRVTGQGEPLPRGGEAVLVEAGFVPRTIRERVGRSEVMLVVAERR